MATTHASTRHFGDLDGMRGLLAVLVMLQHYGLNTIINRFVPLGDVQWSLCVDIFFLLSGLVLCRSVAGKGTGALQFAWKRFGRLFPMHWAILLIFAPVFLATSPTMGEAVHEIFVTGPLAGKTMFNIPAWSMGFEFYLPIVIVALIRMLPPVPARIYVLATLAFALVMGWLVYLILSGQVYPMVGRLIWARAVVGIGLGFLAWALFLHYRLDQPRHIPGWAFVIAVGVLVMLILLGTRVPLLGWLLPVAAMIVLFIGMHTQSLFSWAPMALLGRLSFGIYMVHVPMLKAFEALFGAAGVNGNVVLKALMCLASIALAYILHRLVELPFMRLFRRPVQSWLPAKGGSRAS